MCGTNPPTPACRDGVQGGIGCFCIGEMINRALQFLREAHIELKRVSWPGKREVLGATLVVVTLVLFVGFYIGAVDFILSRLLGFLLR